MEELKPCPFCGEETDIGVYKRMHHGAPVECKGLLFWRVECLPCDCRTGDHSDSDAQYEGNFKDGRESAISSWNRRTPSVDYTEDSIRRAELEFLKRTDIYRFENNEKP